jgi:SSS family solute:Na+ symporter
VCWLLTAYFGPQTDRDVLISFYRKVHPFGPGWRRIRAIAGVTAEEAAQYAHGDNFPLALLGWFAGVTLILSSLFTVGNLLYERFTFMWILLAMSVISGWLLIWVVRRLWS